MSRRPRIQSKHEKQVERRIQAARQARDRAGHAAGRRPRGRGIPPEPQVFGVGRGPVDHPIPRAVRKWIEEESREQLKHYRRISQEMEALSPLRDQWVRQFYERITGPRGFSVHAGTRRTIPQSDLPERPARPWRVVW